MAKYESKVKQVPYSQAVVYGKVSDLSNLEAIKERINDPAYVDKMREQIPDGKWEEVKQHIEAMECTADSLSFSAGPVGNISLAVENREPMKCVKYTSTNSPVAFKLWIQVLPTSDTTSKLKVTIDADLNFFIKQMIGKKLEEGVDKFADMLATIPYTI